MDGDASNPRAPAALLAALIRAWINATPPPAIDDWKGVFRESIRHKVAASVFPFARTECAASIPNDVRAAWRANALAAAAAATRIDAQRAELLDILRDASVPCIPVKGAWLSARVYPAGSIRSMTDIDILVRPRDVGRATGAMAARGYVLKRAADTANPLVGDTALVHPSRPCPVDVHWSYDSAPGAHLPPAPMDALWDGARRDAIDGHPFLALAPEDHLVLLANHLFHHDFARPLRAHLDMALLLRSLDRDGCDAARLHGMAASWGMERAVALSTAVASDLFGAPSRLVGQGIVPDAGWEPKKRRAAFSLALEAPGPDEPVAARRIDELRRLGPVARLRFIASRIMVSDDELRARYPQATTRIGLLRARFRRIRDIVAAHGRDAARAVSSRDSLPASVERRMRLSDWATGN